MILRARALFGGEESLPVPSLLRDLAVDLAIEAGQDDPFPFIDQAALLVREAGLEHLVGEATLFEVRAMTRAGARIEKDRAAARAVAFHDLPAALRPYDGGELQRRQILDAMSVSLEKGSG